MDEEKEATREAEKIPQSTVSTRKLVHAQMQFIAPLRLGLVADYASSDEDSDTELAVKASLLPST